MNRDIAFLPLDPFCPTADEDILKAFTLLREEEGRILMDSRVNERLGEWTEWMNDCGRTGEGQTMGPEFHSLVTFESVNGYRFHVIVAQATVDEISLI